MLNNGAAIAEKIEPKTTKGGWGGARPNSGGRRPGSGRKRGTPNKATADVKALATRYGQDAIERIAELAGLVVVNGQRQGVASSETAQLQALGVLLDRGFGKATATIAGDPDKPLHNITRIEFVVVDPDADTPPAND